MKVLVVKELADFKDAFRRDVIADGMSQPNPLSDKLLLNKLVDYGNAYLEKAEKDPQHAGAVIWFDIHFGDPAVVGMTWALNPHHCEDPKTGLEFFWRIWSETDPAVGSLKQCQHEFNAYTLQHLAVAR